MTFEIFYQPKGGTPSKVASHSHYNEPIPKDGQPHGNSRRHGDASPEVQEKVIQTLIAESRRQGLSREDTAHVLAIARIESGFNPDAAAGETSASGIGQFIDKTGSGYGIGDRNRFDLQANARALVAHYVDNKELAMSNGKDASWVYKYHHDGPVQNSGGLALARNDVLPYAKAYMASAVLADLPAKGSEAFYRTDAGGRQVQLGGQSDTIGLRNVAQAGARDFVQQTESLGGRPPPQNQPRLPSLPIVSLGSAFDIKPQFLEERAARQPTTGGLEKSAPSQPEGSPSKREPMSESRPAEPEAPRQNGALPHRQLQVSDGTPHITLTEALAVHMTEKGFDGASLAKAPDLARQLEAIDARSEPGTALVLHKEGDALASLVGRADADAFAQRGDSVLALDKLERVAKEGLDTDAVATLRGLAPERTQPYSDLEVYQSAPAALYAAAKDPAAPMGSPEQARELLAGLSTAGGVLSQQASPAHEATRTAEARQATQAAEMAMSA